MQLFSQIKSLIVLLMKRMKVEAEMNYSAFGQVSKRNLCGALNWLTGWI